jgi:hypothetical protein
MVEIRRATEADWEDIWPIVNEVFSRGDTYPYPPHTEKEKVYEIWMISPTATYVALAQLPQLELKKSVSY